MNRSCYARSRTVEARLPSMDDLPADLRITRGTLRSSYGHEHVVQHAGAKLAVIVRLVLFKHSRPVVSCDGIVDDNVCCGAIILLKDGHEWIRADFDETMGE